MMDSYRLLSLSAYVFNHVYIQQLIIQVYLQMCHKV